MGKPLTPLRAYPLGSRAGDGGRTAVEGIGPVEGQRCAVPSWELGVRGEPRWPCTSARRGHDTVVWDRNPDRCDHINAAAPQPPLPQVQVNAAPRALRRLARSRRVSVARAELVVPVVPSHALRGVHGPRCAGAIPADGLGLLRHQGHRGGHRGHDVPGPRRGAPRPPRRSRAHQPCSTAPPSPWSSPRASPPPWWSRRHRRGQPPRPPRPSTAAPSGPTTPRTWWACASAAPSRTSWPSPAGSRDGVGLGANARAALITRGLAEISRLAVALGGQSRSR